MNENTETKKNSNKVLLAVIAVLLIIIAVLAAMQMKKPAEKTETVPAAAETVVTESAEADAGQMSVYDRIKNIHAADDVVMTIDGKDVTWGEYWYWLGANIKTIESYYAESGEEIDWDVYGDYSKSYADETIRTIYTLNGYLEKNGIEPTAEEQSAAEDYYSVIAADLCGEGAGKEQLIDELAKDNISIAAIDHLVVASYGYNAGFNEKYGENAEKLSYEDTVAFLEDEGFVSAYHILLTTVDMTTREPLGEDEVSEKRATAEKILQELKEIDAVEIRTETFRYFIDEYNEDPGMTVYTDGYIFDRGVMVEEFDAATRELGYFEVSDIVETSYGYHIILRVRINPDGILSDSSHSGLTGRQYAAQKLFSRELDEYFNNMSVEHTALYDALNIKNYLG